MPLFCTSPTDDKDKGSIVRPASPAANINTVLKYCCQIGGTPKLRSKLVEVNLSTLFGIRLVFIENIKKIIMNLKPDHKQHLSLLFSQPPQVLQDFCRLAFELLKKGANQKLYAAAAQKLDVEVDAIRLAVEALVQLLIESRRHSLSEEDLQNSLVGVGFSDEQQLVLREFHHNSKADVDSVLSTLTPSLSHYHDLEWRFDVQVATRSLMKQITPLVTMKLTLEDRPPSDEKMRTSILMQTDPNNLKHITEKLEEALREASSQHSRRIQRTLK